MKQTSAGNHRSVDEFFERRCDHFRAIQQFRPHQRERVLQWLDDAGLLLASVLARLEELLIWQGFNQY